MIVTGILFVAVTALVKFMGPTMPAVQAAFLRYALGLILLVPLLSWRKGRIIRQFELAKPVRCKAMRFPDRLHC